MATNSETYGTQAAPAANTVIADTAAIDPGTYDVAVTCGSDDTAGAGRGFSVEHRNAANNATLHGVMMTALGGNWHVFRMVIADGERIRVRSGTGAATAATTYTADIRIHPVV